MHRNGHMDVQKHVHVHMHMYALHKYTHTHVCVCKQIYTDSCMNLCTHSHMYVIYVYICLWIKTLVVAGPAPSVTNLCRGPSVANPCRGPLCRSTVVFKGLVAEGFVAEHPRLLQTFVAKWPPKPVTRPMFLIRCHIYTYTYINIYIYIHTCVSICTYLCEFIQYS